MNKNTKYFFLLKTTFLVFILNLVLGFVVRFLQSSNVLSYQLANPIIEMINVVKVLLVISIVIGLVYLAYLIVMYFNSRFYQDYRISILEAIYHGFVDIHQLYDNIVKNKEVVDYQVDFKRQTIYFSTDTNHYSLVFLDLFGKFEGREDSEFWAKLSKPKKEYGRKVYTKKDKFSNPYRSNQEFIRTLQSKTGIRYQNYVAISGFYNMNNKSNNIIAPYEIIDLLNN